MLHEIPVKRFHVTFQELHTFFLKVMHTCVNCIAIGRFNAWVLVVFIYGILVIQSSLRDQEDYLNSPQCLFTRSVDSETIMNHRQHTSQRITQRTELLTEYGGGASTKSQGVHPYKSSESKISSSSRSPQ